MRGETFTVTIAEPLGNTLLEFSKGVLQERCTASSEMNFGSFRPRTEKSLTFEQAFSKAMSEVADDTLAGLCDEILKSRDFQEERRTIARMNGMDPYSKIILGLSRGALLSYSYTYGGSPGSGSLKRITCKFTVLVAGKA